jgi:hypothetical protein
MYPPLDTIDDRELFAHRDQGLAAYLIATGFRPCFIADADTASPLFVFAEPCGPIIENAVTTYKMHELNSYKHSCPQRAHARAMACADRRLDQLVRDARARGERSIAVPDDMIWLWLADGEEREAREWSR